MVSVTELRSGAVVVTGEFTDDEDAARAFYSGDWEQLSPIQKTVFIGNHQFADSSVFSDNTWYLLRIEGGSDYYADGNFLAEPNPVPVIGAIHAIVSGAQLKSSGFLVTPMTDAVYQYLKEFVDDLTDQELAAELDQAAAQLVGDIDSDEDVDYVDVLKYSRVLNFNNKGLVVAKADVSALTTALSAGDAVLANTLADAMFAAPAPVLVAEKAYASSIADIIDGASCGPGCHYSPGIATSGPFASDNVLVPGSNPDFASINTANFASIVATDGVSYILGKVSASISHQGGPRLTPGSSDYNAFEAWLNLL